MKEPVYIYGAGKLGQKCYEEVRKRGWTCKGFVVSSKKGQPERVLDIPVIDLQGLQADMNCIVAVKDEYRLTVLENLWRKNISETLMYRHQGEYKSFLKINISDSLRKIGTGYGSYTISGNLPPAPVVFSFGVGEDIQFETGILHEHPDAKIFAFDPTPRSIAFMKFQNTGRIAFLPFGLSDKNETEMFYMPMNEEYVSCSVIKHEGVGQKEIPVEMRTLATLMAPMRHFAS